MNRIVKRLAALAAGVALISTAAGCGTVVEPEQIILRYSGGPSDGSKFLKCFQPATVGDWEGNDTNYFLPVSLRTWNIRPSGQGGDSDQPIVSGTLPKQVGDTMQPGPEVKVFAKTEFYLNTDCGAPKDGEFGDGQSPLVQWWERTGRRYKADTDDGWKNMLLNTLVPAQEKAVRAAARMYDADILDAGTDNVWAKMEAQMAAVFLTELNASVGGANYFCGPQFKRATDGTIETVKWSEAVEDPAAAGGVKAVEKSGKCPPVRISIIDVNMANQAIADARAQAYVEEQAKRAAKTKADSQAEVAGIIKGAGPAAADVQRLEYELKKEQERTRQVQACAAAGARCLVGVNGGVTIPQ